MRILIYLLAGISIFLAIGGLSACGGGQQKAAASVAQVAAEKARVAAKLKAPPRFAPFARSKENCWRSGSMKSRFQASLSCEPATSGAMPRAATPRCHAQVIRRFRSCRQTPVTSLTRIRVLGESVDRHYRSVTELSTWTRPPHGRRRLHRT